MLLLDDGAHFIYNFIAATKFAKAFHLMGLPWLHRMYVQVQSYTQVFLDSVIQRVTVRQVF